MPITCLGSRLRFLTSDSANLVYWWHANLCTWQLALPPQGGKGILSPDQQMSHFLLTKITSCSSFAHLSLVIIGGGGEGEELTEASYA